MKKAVIFDLGRVLVDVDINRGFFRLFNVNLSQGMDNAVQELMSHSIFKKFNQGHITPEQFYEKIKVEFNIEIDFKEFVFQWCNVFSVMPGMYEVVESLSKDCRLGLLSDTDPIHWNFLKKNYEILDFFPKPVLSFNAKICKPSLEVFRIAAQSVDRAAEDCVYIDDLPKNVEAARSIGMKAIKFISSDQISSELSVETLS